MDNLINDGACVFCGQIIIGDGECDCANAVAERNARKSIADGKEVVRRFFTGDFAEQTFAEVDRAAVDTLLDLVEPVARKTFRDVAVNIDGTGKCVLKRTAKGMVRIARVEKREVSEEV